MSGARTIIVTGKKVVHTGTNPKTQQEFHIWQVDATKPDGSPITEKLRTFEDLPIGEQEVTIEPYDHEKYGRSYTVKKATAGGNPGSRLGPKVDELRDRVDVLERQVAALMAAPPTTTVQPTAAPVAPTSTFGDDPPF